MDTIPRERVARAVERLGLDPSRTQELTIDPNFVTAVRRVPKYKWEDNAIEALSILGYPAHEVHRIHLDHHEIRVELYELDENGQLRWKNSRTPDGNPCREFITRVEVCNVSG
ncbi:MAG: hypothetical protein ACTHJ9_00660 [Rhodanobacter sp.]